jgi:RNA polymerase sigma factor (sigma-70 family)
MDEDSILKFSVPPTNREGKSDFELLLEMAAGDPPDRTAAFNEFFLRHREYLYGICVNCVRNSSGAIGADDLYTATFRRAFDRAETFESQGEADPAILTLKARAWLGVLAQRILIDWLRDDHLLPAVDPESSAQMPSPEPQPESCPERAAKVRAALETLNEKERSVLWASAQFYKPGSNHQRIPSEDLDALASSLNMTKVNFRQTRNRAKKKIAHLSEAY